MMPQWYLHSHGLDVMHDIENHYVGSQESSMMNVYQGAVAAGATWPPPWRAFAKERPEVAAALEVMWETEPLINNGLMAHREVPAATVEQVGRLLFNLHDHGEGRTILAQMELSRFEPADDTTYGVVKAFLERFEGEVRPIREGAP
jgi:phosphonate transport system substrate-binding protein